MIGRVTDNPQIEGLSFEHLYSESMTLVVRPDHALLGAGAGQLGDYPWCCRWPAPASGARRTACSCSWASGAPRRLETLSVALSRRYVLDSDAVWVAPLDAVRQDLACGELVELDLV